VALRCPLTDRHERAGVVEPRARPLSGVLGERDALTSPGLQHGGAVEAGRRQRERRGRGQVDHAARRVGVERYGAPEAERARAHTPELREVPDRAERERKIAPK